jgi:hypothetical protein
LEQISAHWVSFDLLFPQGLPAHNHRARPQTTLTHAGPSWKQAACGSGRREVPSPPRRTRPRRSSGNDELAFIQTHDLKLDHESACTVSAGASYAWKNDFVCLDFLPGEGLRKVFANTGNK